VCPILDHLKTYIRTSTFLKKRSSVLIKMIIEKRRPSINVTNEGMGLDNISPT